MKQIGKGWVEGSAEELLAPAAPEVSGNKRARRSRAKGIAMKADTTKGAGNTESNKTLLSNAAKSLREIANFSSPYASPFNRSFSQSTWEQVKAHDIDFMARKAQNYAHAWDTLKYDLEQIRPAVSPKDYEDCSSVFFGLPRPVIFIFDPMQWTGFNSAPLLAKANYLEALEQQPANGADAPEKNMLDISEAAGYAHVSTRTIRNWLKSVDGNKPMLAGVKGKGRLTRIPRESLTPYIKKGASKNPVKRN